MANEAGESQSQAMSDEHSLVEWKGSGDHATARRPGLIGALIGMLALDWAALDDLTTDPGTSWFLEGLFVMVSVPVIAILVKSIVARRGNPDAE